ncbi:recombinase family protein [Yinghuangia seranimata]|nr:recombinase family protein [Yinghuangia seranimata]MDI2127595.1 recombinase family protein [Yinghuangia seranimata]
MGKMVFNILATFAEFKVDLPRMRTREGMAVARAKGKLKGKQPKLTARQQSHLSITSLASTPSPTCGALLRQPLSSTASSNGSSATVHMRVVYD